MRHSEKIQLRSKRIEIRLTEAEYARIKEKSANFGSIGHYIRSAIKEFSDVNAKRSLEMVDELSGYYKEYRDYGTICPIFPETSIRPSREPTNSRLPDC